MSLRSVKADAAFDSSVSAITDGSGGTATLFELDTSDAFPAAGGGDAGAADDCWQCGVLGNTPGHPNAQ